MKNPGNLVSISFGVLLSNSLGVCMTDTGMYVSIKKRHRMKSVAYKKTEEEYNIQRCSDTFFKLHHQLPT